MLFSEQFCRTQQQTRSVILRYLVIPYLGRDADLLRGRGGVLGAHPMIR